MSTLQNLSVLKSTCQLHQKLNEMQLGLTAMLLQSQRKTFLKSLINLKIYSGLLKKKKKNSLLSFIYNHQTKLYILPKFAESVK